MNRRNFLTGLASIVAAPTVIRTINLMPVKIIKPEIIQLQWTKEIINWKKVKTFEFVSNIILSTEDIFNIGEINAVKGVKDTKKQLDAKLRRKLETFVQST